MDESVAVSIPKINKIASLKTGQSKMNKPTNKSIKKQLSTHNPVIKSNCFPSQVLLNIKYINQGIFILIWYIRHSQRIMLIRLEYNFININIAPPSNGRFTQNIYMNFPPGSNVPITNINTNNVMINNIGYTNNKINFDNIIIGKDKRTTLMLRNIPNKYTLNNIVDEIGCSFWGKYDCINLPIDYDTKLNLGYAFINFTDPLHIIHFFSKFHLKKWSRYKSEKKMDMTYADKQGKKDITLKADNNYFPQDDKRFDFNMLKPLIEIPCVSYCI